MSGFKTDTKTEKSKAINVIRMVSVYFSLISVLDVYFESFRISGSFVSAALIMIPIVFFSYYMVYISKYRKIRISVFFIAVAAVVSFNRKILTKGMEDFLYSYTQISNASGEHDKIPENAAGIEFYILLFLILTLFALTLAAVLLIKQMWVLPLIIMLLPVVLVSCAGYLPSIPDACQLMISGIFYMICYRFNKTREIITAFAGAAVLWIAMIAVSMFFVPKIESYRDRNSTAYKSIRESLKNLGRLNFDDVISKAMEDRGNYTKAGIGKGNLRNLTNCKPEGREKLEVTVSELPTSRVYIKAFVGTTYTGEQWEGPGENALEKLKTLIGNDEKQKELFNEPFNILKALNMAGGGEWNNEGETYSSASYFDFQLQNMKIHILDNNTTIGYFPYFSEITDTKGLDWDLYIEGKGRKDYSYAYYPSEMVDLIIEDYIWNYDETGAVDMSSADGITGDESRSELWEQYSEFVAEEYEEYPKNLKAFEQLCNQVKNYSWIMSYQDLSYSIDEVFRENFEYTLSPGGKSDDEDFVESFIEKKRGFCVHFATTATLIYRKFGFPARYVEGYAIPKNKFIKQEDGTYKATVTDEMAHAWCEIFDNEFGWVAKEHTKYYNSIATFTAGDFRETTTKETTAQQPTTKADETKAETTTAAGERESATVSNADSSKEDAVGPEQSNTRIKSKWQNIISIISSVFIILLIAAVFSVVQCGIRINNKMRKFKKRKNNSGIRCIYNEMYEICCFCGLKPKGKTETEIFQQMRNGFTQLSDEEWQWIYDCIMYAAFSGKELGQQERRKMYQLMLKLKKKVWADLSFKKKIIFKLIKAM